MTPPGNADGGPAGTDRVVGGDGGGAVDTTAGAPPLYHVAALDQGFHLEPETLSYWGYDDGTSTLLVAKGGLVFAYDMSPTLIPGSPDQLKWTFPLAEGPAVRAMRLSLDGTLLAIQRSAVILEFVELATGNVFVQGTDRGRGEILSFFFTELTGADMVLVTPTGLELLEFVTRRQGLRLKERVRMPVEWAIYTHETRMVLLGTAAGGTSYIKAFQFVSSGLVALPPFTAGAAASALVLMGSGGGAGTALVSGSPVAAAAVATPPARVPAECLRLIKVYGRVYCAHINRRALRLELYRFYTDTVVLQHTYELFSPDVELAVVDSVIIAHCTDPSAAAAVVASGAGNGDSPSSRPLPQMAGLAMLFDVAAPISQPVANPLPLRLLQEGPGVPGLRATTSQADGELLLEGADAARAHRGGERDAEEAVTPGAGRQVLDMGGQRRHWEYFAPNIVLDRTGQTAYRLALNLAAVAESCSDPAIAVGFLQRRRGLPSTPAVTGNPSFGMQHQQPGASPPPTSPKTLLLSVVRNALQERMPIPTVRAIFEDLCQGYATALDRELAALSLEPGGPAAQPQPVPASSVLMPQFITADELASDLFRWLHDEEVVDAPYLQAALYEYMSAAAGAGIPLPAYLQELAVETLMQQSQDGQVLQLVYCQGEQMALQLLHRLMALSTTASQQPAEVTATAAAAAAGKLAAEGSVPSSATAGDAVGGGAEGAGDGPLCRQVAVDVLAMAALSDRYDFAAPQHANNMVAMRAPYGTGHAVGCDAGGYVDALLAQGDMLRAARVMRRYRVTKPSVKEFIAAVGARGDEAALAAVYRVFQDELLACYPKYDLAVRKVLAPSPIAAVP